MAILKHFQAKTPAAVVHDHEVIYISDDDSSGSDEEYEFEDVVFDVAADDAGYTEARFEELADETDDETAPHEVGSGAQSDSGVTNGRPPEKGGAREMDDEAIATDMTPHHDAGGGGDGDLHDDEASRAEPLHLDQDDDNAHGLTGLRDILFEFDTLRDRVAQLEAEQRARSACRAQSASIKRNRRTSASHRAKRRKDNTIVNTSATRVYVQWDNTSERCLYTWKRGRGGHCWVGGDEGSERDEVDGGYLLCCATSMSIELRANADWLPIEVRQYDQTAWHRLAIRARDLGFSSDEITRLCELDPDLEEARRVMLIAGPSSSFNYGPNFEKLAGILSGIFKEARPLPVQGVQPSLTTSSLGESLASMAASTLDHTLGTASFSQSLGSLAQ